MGVRLDFPGGESNRVVTMNGGRTPGRHVIAASITDDLKAIYCCLNGGADSWALALNGGTGWASNALGVNPPQSETVGLRCFIFNTYHDRATRVAISRYLGNKYGATVA
jgi:hypothetical protein